MLGIQTRQSMRSRAWPSLVVGYIAQGGFQSDLRVAFGAGLGESFGNTSFVEIL